MATPLFLTSILLILAPPGSSAQEVICATGFVMDTFCIQRGTLLDNSAARSLIDGEGPQLHSYHCLLDVSQCIASGYELLEPPLAGSNTFCRILRFDSPGNDMMLAYGRARGRAGAGCTTCTGTEGDETNGPSATVYGTISDASTNPPTLSVTMIRPPSEACNSSLGLPYVPTIRNCNAAELLPLFRMHGALMLCSWGFLLPLGVCVAITGRHRDPLWFHVHRGANILGLLLALIGWSIALSNFSVFSTGDTGSIAYVHAVCGCLVMSLGLLQPLNALLRPHKPPNGEARSVTRLAWEVLHKASGYLAITFSFITIAIGTRIISKNNMHYQVSYGVLLGAVVTVGVYLKCVDARFKTVPKGTSQAKAPAAALQGQA